MRALAAAVFVASGVAWAQSPARRVALDAAGVGFLLPMGFEAQRTAEASPDLLGTWIRPGVAGGGPVVLQFATVPGALREGEPRADELPAWRGSDPYPFDDRAQRISWQAFSLHTRAGTATVNGRAMMRVVTLLPLAEATVRVAVFAPAARADEARAVFAAVVASARGEAAWSTPGERLRARALLGVVGAALAGMLAYGAAALLVFRTRDRWRPTRAAALFTIAGLWAAAAVLAPRGQWRVLAQDVALAAVFAHRAWRLRRGDAGR